MTPIQDIQAPRKSWPYVLVVALMLGMQAATLVFAVMCYVTLQSFVPQLPLIVDALSALQSYVPQIPLITDALSTLAVEASELNDKINIFIAG
jgi:hypothetical protein